ncbi:MAG: hypothetical protein ABJN62_01715 [Halioglobus sp.]
MTRYTLWVLCVDDEAFEVLQALSLPKMRLMRLSDHETDDLRSVKVDRTRGEYCWTLTPFVPGFVFKSDVTVARVTYLDADLFFLKDPVALFSEFEKSKKDVFITDHGYAPEFDRSATSGQFCVQFMIFNRQGSEPVLTWWGDRCIEWCYSRLEEGKFGDQKYLDDWPVRFDGAVHVCEQQSLMLAPWNAMRFPYGGAVFFHFHELRISSEKLLSTGNYPLPKPLVKNVYMPYAKELRLVLEDLKDVGFEFRPQAEAPGKFSLLRQKLSSSLEFIWNNLPKKTLQW